MVLGRVAMCSAAVILATGALLGQPAAAASAHTSVSGYKTSHATVALGASLFDRVRISPGAHRQVKIQYRRGGATSWHRALTGKASSAGRFLARYQPPAAGTWHFRLVVKASSAGSAQHTKSRTIVAKAVGARGAVSLLTANPRYNRSNHSYGFGMDLSPKWSPNGRYVTFDPAGDWQPPRNHQLLVRDLATGSAQVASANVAGVAGDDASGDALWSPDSTWVAFTSGADNLVGGMGGDEFHGFVKNMSSGAIAAPPGMPLGFTNDSTALLIRSATDVLRYELATGTTTDVGTGPDPQYNRYAELSPDTTRLLFTSVEPLTGDDTGFNGSDAFVQTIATGELTRVSVGDARQALRGDTKRARWSPTGDRVLLVGAYHGLGTHDHAFVKNLSTGTLTRVDNNRDGHAPRNGINTAIWSPSGAAVAFTALADDIAPHTKQFIFGLYLRDLNSGGTALVSSTAAGAIPSMLKVDDSGELVSAPSFAPDGRSIAFRSWATDLLAGRKMDRPGLYIKHLP